jgi:flagellar basal-body rod protein FlgB
LLAARQRVAAGNIANADTPGYRARDIDFRREMESLLNQPSASPPYLPITVRESWGEPAKNDGNNVNLDKEMKVLAENVLRFTVASLLLQKQIRGVRNAIQEGRGG